MIEPECVPKGSGCLDARCEQCWVDGGQFVELPESSLDTERPPPLPSVSSDKPKTTWTLTGSLLGICDRDRCRYTTVVQPIQNRWQVLGLVTPISSDLTLDNVLDHHSHQDLGHYPEMDEARFHAQRFLERAPVPLVLCGCTELGKEES